MSWYTSASNVEKDSAHVTLSGLNVEFGSHNPAISDCSQQFNEAVHAAVKIIESGAVGDGPFQVSISGHANPGNKDLPGWANDCINVSVTRQSAPKPQE